MSAGMVVLKDGTELRAATVVAFNMNIRALRQVNPNAFGFIADHIVLGKDLDPAYQAIAEAHGLVDPQGQVFNQVKAIIKNGYNPENGDFKLPVII